MCSCMNKPQRRQTGILTPGLCVVADTLPVHEAYELGHHRPAVENIKVRPKSFTAGSADDVEILRNGDFHVICDAKFDFTRIDEAMDTLGLFARGGVPPDAITYSRSVEARVLSELARVMMDSRNDISMRSSPPNHTIVLTAILPEQRWIQTRRIPVLREKIDLAHRLISLGAGIRVAIYGSGVDFAGVELPEGVLSIGAGVREKTDELWGYSTIENIEELGIDIPLIGSVMGATKSSRLECLDRIAPTT